MKRTLLVAGLFGIALPATSSAQQVLLEPAAIGFQYAVRTAGGFEAGAEAVGGPQFGVQLGESADENARTWAAAYLRVGVRTAGGLTLHVGPVGAALVVGNDYSAVYPSGQAGLDYGRGRLAVGTLVRVVRVPLAGSRVEYRTSWVPIRLSYSLWR